MRVDLMRFLLPILLLTVPAVGSPPHNWPSDFSAAVTLSGVTEREHFVWDSSSWRNDPEPLWDLILLPPDTFAAFILSDLNSSRPNVALYLGGDGQFVVDDPANNIRDAQPTFAPEPLMGWMALGTLMLVGRVRRC